MHCCVHALSTPKAVRASETWVHAVVSLSTLKAWLTLETGRSDSLLR